MAESADRSQHICRSRCALVSIHRGLSSSYRGGRYRWGRSYNLHMRHSLACMLS